MFRKCHKLCLGSARNANSLFSIAANEYALMGKNAASACPAVVLGNSSNKQHNSWASNNKTRVPVRHFHKSNSPNNAPSSNASATPQANFFHGSKHGSSSIVNNNEFFQSAKGEFTNPKTKFRELKDAVEIKNGHLKAAIKRFLPEVAVHFTDHSSLVPVEALLPYTRLFQQLAKLALAEPTPSAIAAGDNTATATAATTNAATTTSSTTTNTNSWQHLIGEFLERKLAIVNPEVYKNVHRDHKVNYDQLQYIFTKHTLFFTHHKSGMKIGGQVVSTKYEEGHFFVNFRFVACNGKEFVINYRSISVDRFFGTIPISDLSLVPMDLSLNDYHDMVKRGQLFEKYAMGVHHMQYTGIIYDCAHGYYYKHRMKGRVIIDHATFEKLNPNYPVDFKKALLLSSQEKHKSLDSLHNDPLLYAITSPLVFGFSFDLKEWGEFDVSLLQPIVYRKDAMKQLVLPQKTKLLVQGVVEQSRNPNRMDDVIAGKGSAYIILLHGGPGIGKTLSAEATAETLERPFYSVSIGELGVDPLTLEKNLREVLEMSSTWNCVLLLDEADIFLEKRNDMEITRNALVGIMLRLLEYHDGVLFLTTNRVKSFDPAFHSRITIAIHYPDLDQQARAKIWELFLQRGNIDGLDVAELSQYQLNGRQIKNVIRLAQAVAWSEGKANVTMEDVQVCIDNTLAFQKDLA